MRHFFRGLSIQQRVWVALFMREMQTRWGRRNLGFAWLFAEPLFFAFPVFTMWYHIRASLEHGLPMMEFVWSGYMPLLIFRHVTNNSLYLVRSNSALLYHSVISPLDLFVGKCGLEALGNLAACVTSFLVLYMLGFLHLPYNFPVFLAGFLLMTWWALATALIVAALSERSDYVEHIWMTVSYMYVIVSGFMFMAGWLPPSVRHIALLIDPPLDGYEIIRSGLFGPMVHTYALVGYFITVLAIMTFVGLWLMRNIRQHVEIQ